MAMAIGVFALVTMSLLALALVATRNGRNRENEVLAGGSSRPLIFGGLTEALAGMLPCGEATRVKLGRFLRLAGHYHRQALAEFLALRNVLAVGWLLLTAVAFVLLSEPGAAPPLWIAMAGVVGALLGFALPRLFLESLAKARQQRIEESLPDALDMVTMCMVGGLPLQKSLARVSEEMRPTHRDLAFELRVISRQMEAGSFEGALRQFAQRVDTPDVQSLAALIRQTEQQGNSVAAAFHDFSDQVRQTRRQRADEQGNKTAVKMLFPLVFCLAPPVYVMLLAPAVIELSEFVRKENQPGGALSASADNMSAVFADDANAAAPAGGRQ